MKVIHELHEHEFNEVVNLAGGLFAPLKGFLGEEDYLSCLREMRLASGEPWPIPISLAVSEETHARLKGAGRLHLSYRGRVIGHVRVESRFIVNPGETATLLFGTQDPAHPGVGRELARPRWRVGGWTAFTEDRPPEFGLAPAALKALFLSKGWRTIAGFQTRNPIHSAHEYLLRTALEVCDGLFLNPLLGWKRAGDFSEQAVLAAAETLCREFFPADRVHLQGLRTEMRYAGPREALFHALIRRNQGCTHFIVGRDHAGVGGYYGAYQAHDLIRSMLTSHDLGIVPLLMKEPYFCTRCGQIVSERTCRHGTESKIEISGTLIRQCLRENRMPDPRQMRGEICEAILALGEEKFIKE